MEEFRLDVKDIIQGYGERYERLLLFEPLNKLSAMQKKDRQQQPIDMRGLGLLTLLYFFEQKIMRNTKAGRRQLADFLYNSTQAYLDLTLDEYIGLAGIIIETFRPGNGKVKSAEFFNFDTGQQQEVSYQYLKANSFNASTNEQFYILDEHGLELVLQRRSFIANFSCLLANWFYASNWKRANLKGHCGKSMKCV